MSIQTVGLFGNADKPEISDAVARTLAVLKRAGVRVLAQSNLAHVAGDAEAGDDAALLTDCDVLVAFGGDGTLLRAARAIGEGTTPILGINLGSLGYLTDVPLAELEPALENLLQGDYTTVERSRVVGIVKRDNREQARFAALNDLVVNMGSMPRALHMELRLDQATLGRFIGDGLIVATPTGSTAYNLSAGGPIVHPAIRGFLVTPICPHTLAIRPLLVPEDKTIELRLHETGQGATLTADGQTACTIETGDRILYRRDAHPVHLIKFSNSDFFRAMRHKLKWGAIKRRRNRSA